ncbi:cytochrome P450 71A1-like [Olea europaea subsp. europaea]|uniref:Cytochrome P450 71A1-like n=1 Tax=Olea europaea subsp. europaea TaxID=158383 RepID=A0A8S0PGM3_OLEEU|nr:cytochrome P450 71A1-like [Olea europaea subsp. europaea]
MDLPQWLKECFLLSILLASILLVLGFKFFSNKNFNKRNLKTPPSPSKLPVIGNLHQLGNMPHLSLYNLSKRFGPIISLQLGQIPTVVISSARMAKEAIKNHDLALSSRPQIFSAKHLFYNCTDIAFSPYSAYWRHIRKITILELLSARRVQSYDFVREEEVARLIQRIGDSYPGTANLSKMVALYANDVLCRVVFGRDFSEGGEYDRHGFQKMLEEYQELLGGFSIGDFFPSMEFMHTLTGTKSRLVHTFRRFDKFFDEVIKDHLSHNNKKDHKDFVDVLLEVQKSEDIETSLTMDNVKAILLDMFAAGTDTTFITLDWGMTELVMNPKVLEKAQAEVRSIVGERRFVSESDLPQLHYMKAVIKEIFRLHPPAPVLVPRESMEEITIGGYTIPEKTRIFINAWAIGRDPESWQNPDLFEPERFMGSNIDYKGQDFELIPFGTGRRSCPAIAFSSVTVELALAQLLHSFDWKLPTGVQVKDLDMTEVFGITMHRISPLITVAKPYFSEIKSSQL